MKWALLILIALLVLAQAQSSTSKIHPNDWIDVSVWKEPDLSRTVFVQPEGTIALPIVGEIHAEGLTLEELQDQITKRLERYLADPKVRVAPSKAPSKKLEKKVQPKVLPDTWTEAENCKETAQECWEWLA